MTKGALYRHYKSKRDIFDCIVERMEQGDSEQAAEYDMPEDDKESMPDQYKTVSLEEFVEYSKSMFAYKLQLKNKKNSLQNKWYSATITTKKTSWR